MFIGYLYLLIPFVIFLCGWVRTWITVTGLVILLFCTFKIWKEQRGTLIPDIKKFPVGVVIASFLIITLWVLLSGIGGLSYQNYDHLYRNRIYEILVEHPWPVTGESFSDSNIEENRRLVYYIGFWLPAAVIGKIFGTESGYIFQIIWTVIGILTVLLLFSKYLGTFKIWPLLIFIGFSGLDFLGYTLLNGYLPYYHLHLEWWNNTWQFSSLTTQLYWVFNQAIPAWIATLLLLNMKSNRWTVLVFGLLLLNSPLPFIGLLPIAAYLCLSRQYSSVPRFSSVWFKCFFKDTFTVENILGGGFSGILIFLYFCGNDAGSLFAVVNIFESVRTFYIFLLFILLECGLYLILVYRQQPDKGLFFVTVACLLICPIFRIGEAADLCMRASIPALLVLYLMVCRRLEMIDSHNLKAADAVLVLVLSIGAFTPFNEISRSVSETVSAIAECGHVDNLTVRDFNVMTEKNFSGETTNNLFSEYIARQ